jgi:flavin-dependent dehydrogenase
MVSARLAGGHHDVVVVGGGPAGLAAAIVAADLGASVLVVEQRAFPPDKACGEGLLPPAVRALDRLGVLEEIAPEDRRPFAGIRFVQEDGTHAVLPLPSGGLGIRRTALVEAMMRRAARLGVTLADRTPVHGVDRDAGGAVVRTGHGDVGARLVVAADGLHSPLRRAARLHAPASTRRRFAVRQHFAVRPWTDHVEVYVDQHGEAVVTPVADDAINVNCVWEPESGIEPPTFDGLDGRFPALHARLAGAPTLSTVRGAGPMERRARRRTCERMLLIGDAGGFIDSIAADGLSMTFNSALVLREMLPAILAADATVGSLAGYERGARRLFRGYQLVTGTLLWIARHPTLRRRLICFLAGHQAVGDAMMSGAMRLMLANVPA